MLNTIHEQGGAMDSGCGQPKNLAVRTTLLIAKSPEPGTSAQAQRCDRPKPDENVAEDVGTVTRAERNVTCDPATRVVDDSTDGRIPDPNTALANAEQG